MRIRFFAFPANASKLPAVLVCVATNQSSGYWPSSMKAGKPWSGILSIVCGVAGHRGPRSDHLLTTYACQRHEVTATRSTEIHNYASYRQDTATRLEHGSMPGVSTTERTFGQHPKLES